MQNNDFYNNPKTLDFITETEKELEDFKKKITIKRLDEALKVGENSSDIDSNSNNTAEDDSNNHVQEIADFFEQREKFNKEVEKATKKVYSENYRKPPKEYQYKKDHSGNYNGRPPKKPVFTMQDAIYKALYKEIETTQNGKKKMKPLIEVFGETVVRDAIKKDGPSRKFLLQDPMFTKHNFMEPLIEEAIERIKNKPEFKLDEKMKQKLFQTIAKLYEKNEPE